MTMAEIKAQVEQVTNSFEKVIADQSTRFEGAAAELAKLQTKGLAQAQAFFDDATRITREQLAFAEQLGAEWRKLVLSTAKSTSERFASKA
jgi:hypothetical protein